MRRASSGVIIAFEHVIGAVSSDEVNMTPGEIDGRSNNEITHYCGTSRNRGVTEVVRASGPTNHLKRVFATSSPTQSARVFSGGTRFFVHYRRIHTCRIVTAATANVIGVEKTTNCVCVRQILTVRRDGTRQLQI